MDGGSKLSMKRNLGAVAASICSEREQWRQVRSAAIFQTEVCAIRLVA